MSRERAAVIPIPIVIADDHEIVRHGLVSLFKDTDIRVVGQAEDDDDAVKLARRLEPAVLLLDVRLAGRDGLGAIKRIRTASPATRVVILSAFDNAVYVARAISAGAHDYLLKTATREELVDAVRAAAAGSPPSRRGEFRRVAGILARKPPPPAADVPLTGREVQVLRLVATGLSNQEIADSLGISVETVKEHVQNMLRKTALNDRTQAAVWAIRQGIA